MATQENTKISNSQIVQVQASFYTTKELENLTVVEVTRRGDKTKEKKSKSPKDQQVLKYIRDFENSGVSVSDNKMGATDENACTTCNQTINRCPGHFGRVTIVKPFLTRIEAQLQVLGAILNAFCDSCLKEDTNCGGDTKHSNVYPTLIYDSVTLKKVMNLQSHSRLNALNSMGLKCPLHNVSYEVKNRWNGVKRKSGDNETFITPENLSKYLSKMRSEDLEKIGVYSRPEAMIINIIPVMPNYLRLNYVDDEGIVHPQGINAIYGKLVDLNNYIRVALLYAPQYMAADYKDDKKDERKRLKIDGIKNMSPDEINRFIDQCISDIRDQHHELIFSSETKNNTKSIKMIFDKKKGLLRNNVHGKRGNYCARSTVAPDPTLNIYEVGLPRTIAKELTTLEVVRRDNIKSLNELLLKEGIKSIKRKRVTEMNNKDLPDDLLDFDSIFISNVVNRENMEALSKLQAERKVVKIIRGDKDVQKDSVLENNDTVVIVKQKKDLAITDDIVGYERKGNNILIETLDSATIIKLKLREGDVVHRYLQNGDVVLVGRNPSLHKHSLLALVVEIKDGYTIRMPVQLCAGYAMDLNSESNSRMPIRL